MIQAVYINQIKSFRDMVEAHVSEPPTSTRPQHLRTLFYNRLPSVYLF